MSEKECLRYEHQDYWEIEKRKFLNYFVRIKLPKIMFLLPLIWAAEQALDTANAIGMRNKT